MKRKQAYKPKPQPAFFYTLVYLALRPYLRLRYGYRRPKSLPIREERGPVTVLGNHASNIDFLFSIVALYPKRMNFLVSAHFFDQKPLCYLLRFVQCVRKEQFATDVAAIRDMRSLVTAGGNILLYPEGEVNGTGRTGIFQESTARLCKLLRVPVYAVRTKGSYLTRPKWGPSRRRGRVETEVTRIATAEELAALSNEALDARIREGIFHDEYAWQAQARIPFHAKAPAEGLHRMLYRCPKCGAEFTTRSTTHEIFCTACGNRGRMDEYGFLSPAGAEDVIPASPLAWVDLQRAALRDAMRDPAYRLTARCCLQYHLDGRALDHMDVGEGTVTLDRSGLSYEGMAEGEQVTLHFPLSDLYKLPFSAGLHFEIPPAARVTAIRPLEPAAVWKFVLALPLMKEAVQGDAEAR